MMDQEIKQRDISYDSPEPCSSIRLPGTQPDGINMRLEWDNQKKQWLRYMDSAGIEPEWGQANAGERVVTTYGPYSLDKYAIDQLLRAYKINPEIVIQDDLTLMSPSDLEKIANTLK